VQLPNDGTLRVASIPALALLKIAAWEDRKHSHPGRDAGDLLLYARHYIDCDNLDRAAQHHNDLFTQASYDHEEAGGRLLGRDIANLLDRRSIDRVLSILLPQADTQGPLLLARQSGLDLEHARRLIEALCDGLTDALQDEGRARESDHEYSMPRGSRYLLEVSVSSMIVCSNSLSSGIS
jgi:predicted nucleotidyltransferase